MSNLLQGALTLAGLSFAARRQMSRGCVAAKDCRMVLLAPTRPCTGTDARSGSVCSVRHADT